MFLWLLRLYHEVTYNYVRTRCHSLFAINPGFIDQCTFMEYNDLEQISELRFVLMLKLDIVNKLQ